MIIFSNTLKRLLKKKANVLFMIVFPVIMIAFITYISGGEGQISVGIVDHDSSKFTQDMVKGLEGKAKIAHVKEADIQRLLLDMSIDYAIVIEKGFTQDILKGKDVKLKGFRLNEANLSGHIKYSMESYVNNAKLISKTVNGNIERFYEGIKLYKEGNASSKVAAVNEESTKASKTASGMGFLIMGMIYLSTFAPLIILEDKQNRTFYRMFSSPVTLRSYMLQTILSLLVLSLIQVALIMAIMIFGFNTYFGPNVLNMFLILVIFSLACVSLGIAISSISKDIRQASAIGTLISTPVCMLGGCFWPRDIMPQVLQKISNFVPTTWVLKGMEKLLYGGTIVTVANEILVILLFTLIFFLLGTWRKTDIAK
ncbi:MAG: ABC transporter permease [Clostridia bacterium]|nr:ABC transporter permease [Clostridia bacterium]